MQRCYLTCLLVLFSLPTWGWNAAGHRLVADIAWRQLAQPARQQIDAALRQHPDYTQWLLKAGDPAPAAIFAEAATWADAIRNDPRYYDETSESPTPALPGLLDLARHKKWHYQDVDRDGNIASGELPSALTQLAATIRQAGDNSNLTFAVPWLLHLVADLHQPLHVGHDADQGGNHFEVEISFRRQPFTNLHRYWDELPGHSSLRGRKLQQRSLLLMQAYPAPAQGDLASWLAESRALLADCYPTRTGSLLPLIDEAFHQQATRIAERQLVAAGYRLGRWLNTLLSERVSRETGSTR